MIAEGLNKTKNNQEVRIMKKAYVSPTVEKVEFQYEQSVVASGTSCDWIGPQTKSYDGCKEESAGSGSWAK